MLLRFLVLVALCGCGGNFAAVSPRQNLGTSWGETRRSPVRDVEFERASRSPFARLTLFYDDEAAGRAAPPLADEGVEAAVVDERGRPFETVWARGRTYVLAEEGARYLLRVRNHTGRRIEVVASVDGLDVMDGRAASLNKRGYVIAPWAELTIDGFRRSFEEVAAFRFGAAEESYAARTGAPDAIGVIAFAFFDEQPPRFAQPPPGDDRARPNPPF